MPTATNHLNKNRWVDKGKYGFARHKLASKQLASKQLERRSMFILIDNYDSFTWNLWHFLSDLGAEVITIRNDAKSVEEILAMQPSGLVLSPGPGVPADAGILVDLIKAAPASLPIMGVCLGHQAICTAFGGKLKHFSPPMHGKLSYITHQNQGIFEGIDSQFVVTRYHSLLADEAHLPDCLN